MWDIKELKLLMKIKELFSFIILNNLYKLSQRDIQFLEGKEYNNENHLHLTLNLKF